MHPMIEVDTLTKRYGKTTILDKVSFNVDKGEIFGYLGPNGAGKTTTIRILTTIITPDSGTARVNGYDIRRQSNMVRKSFALVPQGGGLNVVLSVEENIRIYLILQGWSSADARHRTLNIMEALGPHTHAGKTASELSGGLRRRVQLARVLATNAPVMFLDEPSVGLDPQTRRQVWQTIKEVTTSGTTIFLTTQVMEEAEALCDRVAFIRQGQIIGLDKTEHMKRRFQRSEVRIDVVGIPQGDLAKLLYDIPNLRFVDNDANSSDDYTVMFWVPGSDVPTVIPRIYNHGGSVISMDRETPNLEDVYMRVIHGEE